jgi:NTE family protein
MTDGAKRTKLIGTLRLTDGGVYDNMALEPVWKDHAVLLVSDGGATFDAQGPAPVWRPFKSLGRYLEIQGRQGAAVRRRWLVASLIKRELRGVYLGIGSSVKQFDSSAEGYNETLVDELISEVRTDLDYFSDGEAAVLQNHGYLLADAAMRVYGAEWITPASLAIPYPEWMDQDKAIAALRGSAKRAKLGHWRAVPAAKSKVRDAWSWLKRVGRRG